jgi:hypothetical protein
MTVFRLEPVPETAKSHHWRLSKWKGVCWVSAENEAAARHKVDLATHKLADRIEGEPVPYAPWIQNHLVTCIADDGKRVSEDVVLLPNGKLMTVAGL